MILDLKKILGLKKNFDEKMFWVQTKFSSEKILCQKKFGSKKNIGSENFLGQTKLDFLYAPLL